MSNLLIRPMTSGDVDATYLINSLAFAETAEEKERVHARPPEEVERRGAQYHHFLKHDPEGAWVAVDDGRVVGSAVAVVREGVWILALFAVDEGYQGAGTGKRLFDQALAYASGCRGAMIASSTHPAAMRRYAMAEFDLHPTLMASGMVRRSALPANLDVREGAEADLELAASVDRLLRGAAHGPDLEIMLRTGARLLVAERPAGRGYAAVWEGSPALVAATHPEAAAELLWACLADAPEAKEVEVRWISGLQSSWAVPVILKAGLSLSPAGPLCFRGDLGPLAPYLPSGPFL